MLIRRKHHSHRRTMRRLSTNSAAPVALHGIVLRAGGGAIRGLPGAMAGPDNIAVVFVPHAQDEAQLQCCKRTDPSVAQLMSLKRCSGGEAGTPQVKAGAESRRKRCMTAQDACALLKRLTRVAVRSECGAWHMSAHSRHARHARHAQLHQRKHVFPLCKCASSRSEFSSHLALCPAGVLAGGARLVAPQARQPCRIGRVLQRELPANKTGKQCWRSKLRNATCRNCTLKHCRCNTFRRQPMRCSLASDQAEMEAGQNFHTVTPKEAWRARTCQRRTPPSVHASRCGVYVTSEFSSSQIRRKAPTSEVYVFTLKTGHKGGSTNGVSTQTKTFLLQPVDAHISCVVVCTW